MFVCIENPREPIAKLLELIRKLRRLLDVKSMYEIGLYSNNHQQAGGKSNYKKTIYKTKNVLLRIKSNKRYAITLWVKI